MKKSILYAIGLMLAGLTFNACTDDVKFGNAFIDKVPGGTSNLDSIFSNADYANQFLTNIYARQYYGLPFSQTTPSHSQSHWVGKVDALTDIYQMHWAGCQVWNDYYKGNMTAKSDPLISFSNDQVWETVHLVSVFKDNIGRVPGISEKRRKYMVAQAKALQAFAYSVLLPHYGGLPIINGNLTEVNSSNGKRATFEATVDSIVKWCDEANEDLLYWAYNGNDAESSQLQTGRWTKAGVMALKAQVLWLAASPLFNSSEGYYGGTSQAETDHLVWYGDFQQSRWERAVKAFEDFWEENERNGGYYHLVQAAKKNCDGYRIAYRRGYINDDSPENIHWTKVAAYYGTQGTYSWLNWNTWGVNRLNLDPTVEYIEMFPWSDGKPFNRETDMKFKESYVCEADDSTWDVYTCTSGSSDKLFYQYKAVRGGFTKTATRDPRLYENARVSGQFETLDFNNEEGKSAGNVIETWVGGQQAGTCVKNLDGTLAESLTTPCPTGFIPYKYVLSQGEYWRDHDMHWNVLTIPDMILMYAECLAECNRSKEAIDQIDLIRSRVGMKSINYSYNRDKDLLTNKDNLIEEILRERACELGVTNARYIDMIRRKRTDWMVKHTHGMATYRLIKNDENKLVRRNAPWYGDDKNSGMEEPSRFEYEFFKLIQGERVLWNKDPQSLEVRKWLMQPLPQDEINKGYGLVQNPGW